MRALIITHSNDNESVALVTRSLEKHGVRAFRFDTDRFPGEIQVCVSQDASGARIVIRDGDDVVEGDELVAVWHRRLRIGAGIPESIEKQVRAASVEESRRVVYGILSSLPCFVLDPWSRLRVAENKELQLDLARNAGLTIPRTLITNDPRAARAFWDECSGNIVTKMMAAFSVLDGGNEQVVFTTPLKKSDLDALDGLRFCPMTFQERVDKQVELRVTVVGERVFAASIDSNQMERSKTDWRREGLALKDAWKPYSLPADVEANLLRVMDAFGLNYGAADFIVTPEGEHVFLEVNPAGEFFWLELENGFPISSALADVMTDNAPRRDRRPLDAIRALSPAE